MAISKQSSRQARYKIGNSIMNTYGYAVIGASLIQPFVFNGKVPSPVQIAGFLSGVLLHALALYNAPKGETL